MIHKACMPVYMNSGKIVADGRLDGKSKVLQEVLADLKTVCKELTASKSLLCTVRQCNLVVNKIFIEKLINCK